MKEISILKLIIIVLMIISFMTNGLSTLINMLGHEGINNENFSDSVKFGILTASISLIIYLPILFFTKSIKTYELEIITIISTILIFGLGLIFDIAMIIEASMHPDSWNGVGAVLGSTLIKLINVLFVIMLVLFSKFTSEKA